MKQSRGPLWESQKITIEEFQAKKTRGEKIVALSASSFWIARLIDETGLADALVVDRSLATLVLGYPNPLPWTLVEAVHHASAVSRAKPRALVIADMPYLTYELDPGEAARNAGRLVKEGGAQAVKVEGGLEILPSVAEIARAKIAPMGHLSHRRKTGIPYRRGRSSARARGGLGAILKTAKELEKTGCFALLLEGFPEPWESQITRALSIPVLGFGKRVATDGAFEVTENIWGLSGAVRPSGAEKGLRSLFDGAVRDFARAVRGK
jgi:3-methyl-2-oxobutanoate hydroxymethyltransferase